MAPITPTIPTLPDSTIALLHDSDSYYSLGAVLVVVAHKDPSNSGSKPPRVRLVGTYSPEKAPSLGYSDIQAIFLEMCGSVHPVSTFDYGSYHVVVNQLQNYVIAYVKQGERKQL